MQRRVGLDLASTIDIAAMELTFEHEGGYARFGRYYLPEATVELPENQHYRGWRDAPEKWITQTDGDMIDYLPGLRNGTMSWDLDPVVTFRDLADEISSPKAKSQRLAAFAKEKIAEADAINRNALGRDVDREVYVDGSAGRAIEQVSPDGVVFAEWSMIGSVLEWIGEELLRASPILTGKYMRSHILFVDAVEHQPGTPLNEAAAEYAFVNRAPYARKIERGQSPQAPDGVYEVIASMAARRFGNQARIRYSFRSLTGTKDRTDRQPAIIVYPR